MPIKYTPPPKKKKQVTNLTKKKKKELKKKPSEFETNELLQLVQNIKFETILASIMI